MRSSTPTKHGLRICDSAWYCAGYGFAVVGGTTHRSFPQLNKRAQLSDSVGAGLCSARVWSNSQQSGGVEPRPYGGWTAEMRN